MSYKNKPRVPGLCTIQSQTLTLANHEYSVTVPRGTVAIELQAQGAHTVRLAFDTGHVATPTLPYWTVKAGATWFKNQLLLIDNLTFYLASPDAGTVVEIILWSVV
jgi:hypothetical protein